MQTRIERTERCYRAAMREKLIELLKVINPEDQITFGAMNYAELVAYARDWIETEHNEINGIVPTSKPPGLSLD